MTRIGVIGAGQLGMMLGEAGVPMGFEFVFLDPANNPPAASVGPVLRYAFDSDTGLQKLADASDVITYEFENVPVGAIEKLAKTAIVFPPPQALQHAQDRLAEKNLFNELDIPVADFRAIDRCEELHDACRDIGLPVILKTRRFGYDGKGQAMIRQASEIDAAFAALGGGGLIVEQCVPFDREVSAIGARSRSGEIVVYPLTENVHRDGILSVSTAPAAAAGLEHTATTYLQSLLGKLDYVGVLALELFVVGQRLVANEFAPRVHNSGHWTIEGALTSQFENHLRAILGMPLGDTAMCGAAAMINLIGRMPQDQSFVDSPGSYLHDYGKAARPGRKLGHATIVRATAAARDEALGELLDRFRNQAKPDESPAL